MTTASDPPAGAFSTEHARVLLVEDDLFDREYLAHVLLGEFDVLAVADGLAALEAIDRDDFDVVIADHGLPGMAGERLLRECRDRRPVTSRVLLSAVLSLETVMRSVNDGHVFACLQKPIDPGTLLTTVHNAAHACRLVRERSALITELAEANARIHAEQQQLMALNRELSMLVTIATHDLREPLRSTRFFLDRCIDRLAGHPDPDLAGWLGRVARAHDRMDQLLMGLREWLHLQTADVPMARVDVGPVIEEALENLTGACTARDARLHLPPAWPAVEAHAPLLRSVFENLIGNAIKFSPDGPPDVTLRWTRQGERVRFEVQDRGIGIEPAYHEQIFGMFRRLESRRRFDGTGAGLAIVQKIVRRQGGEIGVESERGQGATFWFTLRAAAP